MPFLCSWSDRSFDDIERVQSSSKSADIEYSFDNRLGSFHSELGVARDDDPTMDSLLEDREPVGNKVRARTGARISQVDRVRQLTSIERTVSNLIGDTKLRHKLSQLASHEVDARFTLRMPA